MMKPEPLPPPSREPRCPLLFLTSIFATDGLTASAALVTALEYASSNGPSATGALCVAVWEFKASCSSNTGLGAPEHCEGGHTPKSFSAIFITTTGLAVETPV